MFRFKNVAERRAIVEEPICPQHTGRVRFQGSWWSARCSREITLLPGDVVYVVGNQGIILLVDSEFSSEQRSPQIQQPTAKFQLNDQHRAIKLPCH